MAGQGYAARPGTMPLPLSLKLKGFLLWMSCWFGPCSLSGLLVLLVWGSVGRVPPLSYCFAFCCWWVWPPPDAVHGCTTQLDGKNCVSGRELVTLHTRVCHGMRIGTSQNGMQKNLAPRPLAIVKTATAHAWVLLQYCKWAVQSKTHLAIRVTSGECAKSFAPQRQFSLRAHG